MRRRRNPIRFAIDRMGRQKVEIRTFASRLTPLGKPQVEFKPKKRRPDTGRNGESKGVYKHYSTAFTSLGKQIRVDLVLDGLDRKKKGFTAFNSL